MKLDSEAQRQTLINCIRSAQVSGMVAELAQLIPEIMGVLSAVEAAEIETTAQGGATVPPEASEK